MIKKVFAGVIVSAGFCLWDYRCRTHNGGSIARSAESYGAIVVKFVRTEEKFVEISGWMIVANSLLIGVN